MDFEGVAVDDAGSPSQVGGRCHFDRRSEQRQRDFDHSPDHRLLIARVMPIRANIAGPPCSATSISALIAVCHFRRRAFLLRQFGDVRCSVVS